MAEAAELTRDHEALIQFLYLAPIGLVQASRDGGIQMINPMSAQLLMPMSPDGNLDNLFTILATAVPHLRSLVEEFDEPSGVVLEGLRFSVRPSPSDPQAEAQFRSLSLLKLDEDRIIATLSDVTAEVVREEQGLERRMRLASKVDKLTRMPNRTAVVERLRELATGDHGEFAVLFLNCDRFKQVNDTLGYQGGDELLGLMAQRLRSALRAYDVLMRPGLPEQMAARLGGDEFVVVLENLREADDAHVVSRRILEALAQPYGIGSHQVHCGASIGVVLRAQASACPDALLQDASLAMTRAKRSGGGRHVVFEPAMAREAARRGEIEADLRVALAEEQLFVVYQPVVGLQTRDGSVDRAAGVEALVRWRHPTKGIVPPLEFIGIAEETGLIGELGAFVLRRAVSDFMSWRRELGRDSPRLLAVNLSRAQLDDSNLVALVAQTLERSGMPPEQLQLEVTESLAAQDDRVQSRLHDLKALGLTLALDDFGTGYSSLSSLHQLPVDTVKIDRSFTSLGDTSAHHRVLIEATIRVAASLNMGTVAEGIETPAQAAVARELGCLKGQGYLYSKPLTSPELVSWLQRDA